MSRGNDIRTDGLCKFFINTGDCPSGADCRFIHPPLDQLKKVRTEWVKQRIKQRRLKQHRPEDPHNPSDKLKKNARSQVFADWVLSTFPESLNVVDVAGGKGLVGLIVEKATSKEKSQKSETESETLPRVTATLIDPRPRDISKQMRRIAPSSAEGIQLNAHLQEWFQDPPSETVDELLKRQKTVIIGLHPDQATEPIVDIGLARGIPWAVVPCCVFPELYPNRIWPGDGGGEVNSTEKLIDWLKAKNADIKEAYLPFEGRNRVLYWTGETTTQQSSL
ncbi:hypothetical protein HDU81_006322 [Chytriomyces hyalinus]|nr:hypothetical protein HDU81_006322 [Chytriomyces hyalinus]